MQTMSHVNLAKLKRIYFRKLLKKLCLFSIIREMINLIFLNLIFKFNIFNNRYFDVMYTQIKKSILLTKNPPNMERATNRSFTLNVLCLTMTKD